MKTITENKIGGGQEHTCQSRTQTHYNSIDGLRALSCLGIILMHIQANTKYHLGGSFAFERFVPSLTALLFRSI